MKRAEIERLLPAVIQAGITEESALLAVLDVMEALHEPSERVLERLVHLVHPRETEERLLPMLAHWLDLSRIHHGRRGARAPLDWATPLGLLEPGHLRELIANAAELSQVRGTALGMRRFLEIATGRGPFVLDESVVDRDGEAIPFHLRVRAPAGAKAQRDLIERIVELEKPAYVTHEVVFES